MKNDDAMDAARQLHECWQLGRVIDVLADPSRPKTPDDGYAVQAALAQLQAETVIGWKIAATAQAGRDHINVDRPLAGRLFPSIVFESGASVSMQNNQMMVAEAEFVFKMGSTLNPQAEPFSEPEVAAAISTLHPGLELPDSRFSDFTGVGTACLIADNACASQFVLGPAAPLPFSSALLGDHPSALLVNGHVVSTGTGADALGGPLTALTWLANTLRNLRIPLKAGQFVTTGVTGQPTPVKSGDTCVVDLGSYGTVKVHLT